MESGAAEHDVFVSYARDDRAALDPVLEKLRAAGLDVWIDEGEIGELDVIAARVEDAIAATRVVLAWVTAAYERSPACRWELAASLLAARAGGHRLVDRVLPIAADVATVGSMPAELRAYLFIERPDTEDDIDALVARALRAVEHAGGPLGRPIAPAAGGHLAESMSTATVVGRLSAAAVVDGLLWPVDAPAAGLRGRLPLVVVETLAGGGKTSFVEFYAMTFGGGYPGGALWLDAHGHDPAWAAAPSFQRDADRLDQLAQAASALGVDLSSVDPAVWPATVAASLEAEQRDVLWIVDDLASGSDHADLDLWAPRCSRAHVLASTRDAGSSLAASRFILQPLDDAAALRILTHRLPPTTERELGAAAQLVELVAKHPLTLDVIGAAVAAPGGPRYSEFLSEMTGAVEAAGPTVGQLAVNLPEGAEQAIVAALSSSVRDLTADGFDFLRLAFQLSAAPLPRSFVADVFGARSGGDEGHAARRMRRAFREIDVLKMADRVDDGDAYQLHPVVTMVARLVDDQPDESERMLEAALVSLTTSLAQVIDVSAHQRVRHLVSHGRVLAADASTLERAAILGWVARYDRERGNYTQSYEGFRRQADALATLLGSDDLDALEARSNLAESLAGLGRLQEAYEIQVDELERCKSAFGDDAPSTLASVNNLGALLYQLGRHVEAEALQQDHVARCRRVLGESHEDTLKAMSNHAASLSALGRVLEAAQVERRVLAVYETLEPDRSKINAYHSLAASMRALGEAKESLRLHRREWEIAETLLGPDHPDLLDARFGVALALSADGRPSDAAAELDEVLAWAVRQWGADHHVTLSVRSAVAQVATDIGDASRGVELAAEVLERWRAAVGADHPHAIAALGDLASALYDNEQAAAAAVRYREQFEARRRTLGDEHHRTWEACANLAEALSVDGNADAAPLRAEAVDRLTALVGAQHPSTLAARGNQAFDLIAQGDVEAALAILRDVLTATEERLGPLHPDTISSREQLSTVLIDDGQLDEGLRLARAVLEERREALGEDHPDTASALTNLGVALFNADAADEARAAFDQALAALRRRLGDDAPEVWHALTNQAAMLLDLDQPHEAVALNEQVLEGLRRLGHERRPVYSITLVNLATAFAAADRPDDAVATARQAIATATDSLGANSPVRNRILEQAEVLLDDLAE